MLATKLVTNGHTGRTFHSVGDERAHTAHGYFTASSWRSNSRDLIVSANVNPDTHRCRYVLYNTETGGSRVLAENVPYGAGTSASDDRYYYCVGNKILAVDFERAHVSEVCKVDEEMKLIGPVSISSDGKTVSVIGSKEDHTLVLSVNVPTGRWRIAIDPKFAQPFPSASPVYTDLIFYAHEGMTERIPDRIWVVDADKGEAVNLFKQMLLEDGTVGECVGHEMWSYDGERLYFVKYGVSPLAPKGIYYVTKDGQRWGCVNSEHVHWHAAVSPDGRWAVSDTGPGGTRSRIVLTDVHSGKSAVLCEIDRWKHHPGHPHPSFSPDSSKVSFTYEDESGYLRVGCMDVSDVL